MSQVVLLCHACLSSLSGMQAANTAVARLPWDATLLAVERLVAQSIRRECRSFNQRRPEVIVIAHEHDATSPSAAAAHNDSPLSAHSPPMPRPNQQRCNFWTRDVVLTDFCPVYDSMCMCNNHSAAAYAQMRLTSGSFLCGTFCEHTAIICHGHWCCSASICTECRHDNDIGGL